MTTHRSKCWNTNMARDITSGFGVHVFIVFLLVIFKCFADAGSNHLNGCTVYHLIGGGLKVDCSQGPNITAIPTELPGNTTQLYLDYNRISVIDLSLLTELTHLEVLSASHNLVTYVIYANLPRLSELNLSSNGITSIHKDMLSGLTGLRILNVSSNNIGVIEVNAFRGLNNLLQLDIGNNLLSFADMASVPKYAFAPLYYLKRLWIHNNNCPAYRGDLIANLTRLQELECDAPRCRKGVFPAEYQHLQGLNILRIHGDIEYLTNETFSNLSTCPIYTLSVVGGKLLDIEPMAFKPFQHLSVLDLSGNEKLDFCNVSKAWPGLEGKTNITTLILNNVMNVFYTEALMPCNFFEGLDSDVLNNIRSLHLDGNNLVQIDAQLTKLSSLTELSLRFNRIQKVKHFKCSDTYTLADVPQPSQCYSGCPGGVKPPDNGTYEIGILHLPKNIKRLYLDVAINYGLKPMVAMSVQGCESLEILDLSHNAIQDFIGPFTTTTNQSTSLSLLLRGNYGSTVGRGFLGNKNVHHLDLEDNKLGEQLWSDEEGQTFRDFAQLKSLSIADNRIKKLPRNVFNGLENVEVLNLSHNALSDIEFTFEKMKSLRVIDFKENMFIAFEPNIMQYLDSFEHLSIDLQSNPLVCSCEYKLFLKWLLDNNGKTKKLNYAEYRCQYGDQYISLGEFFTDEYDKFLVHCNSSLYLTVAGVSFGVLTFAIIVLVISYKYRWDIKFICTKLIYRKDWQEISQDDRIYEYDAFVAYHRDDLHWVRTQLVPHLENDDMLQSQSSSPSTRGCFRLCVHDRDFIPGRGIEENIIESIQRSNKTLIVLSKSFVESGWCQFELQMARVNCFDTKKNNVVVIVLEEIPLRLMSSSLQILLRRTIFVEWPFAPVARDDFWERIRKALQGPGRPVLCDCGHAMKSEWATATRSPLANDA